MKIGVLIDRLNVGGVEKIAIEEVRSLKSVGEDAFLLILHSKPVVENAFSDLLIDVPIVYLDQRLPKLLRFSFKFPIFNFFSLFHITYPLLLPWVIKKNEYNFIVSHGTYTCFSAIAFKKFNKIPFAAFIWDPISYIISRVYAEKVSSLVGSVLKKLSVAVDKFILHNADVILVGGDAHNTYLRSLRADVNIIEIPPSVHPLKEINDKKKDYILVVTAWKRGKNPEYLFEIIKKIPDINILLVGRWIDSEYRVEYEKEIAKRNVGKNITVVGEVSEKELVQYYKDALLVLQTNDDRGFGMPALEAAAHGTTFIIPKGQGVCKLFKDNVDGYYTKEKDTTAIASHLYTLINDTKQAYKMGRHAWEKVKSNYSWSNHANQLRKIFLQYI